MSKKFDLRVNPAAAMLAEAAEKRAALAADGDSDNVENNEMMKAVKAAKEQSMGMREGGLNELPDMPEDNDDGRAVTISFSLPKRMLAEVDEACKRRGVTRSRFFKTLISSFKLG